MISKHPDDFISTCVQIACVLVLFEFINKLRGLPNEYWREGGYLFLCSFVLCICTDFLDWKEHDAVKSAYFKGFLTCLHACDGLAVIVLGFGIWQRDQRILLVGLLMITKMFLIHLMNRMILAHKKAITRNFVESFTQTSKSFLHHTASFIFLSHPAEIVITTVWRSISMSAHAALVLRGRVDASTMEVVNRLLSYCRIFALLVLLVLLFMSSIIRFQFADSAVGHVAYLMVRFAPVFRQGGSYLQGTEKDRWKELSDCERLEELLRLNHPWLGAELLLMAVVVIVLLCLRFSPIDALSFSRMLDSYIYSVA